MTIAVTACGGESGAANVATSPTPLPLAAAAGCARTSAGLTPVTDLRGSYQSEPGGLYPGGTNTPPPGHLSAGLTIARAVGPLNADGHPDASGRYGFVSIGMSNTTQEFSTFKPMADADPAKNPGLVIVDGAQGGVTASEWASPSCPCWSTVDRRLESAGLSPRQVVTAWIKLANASPAQPFPAHAQALRSHITATVRNLQARYPNVRLAYLSSRIYAGYATTPLNPEPYAYESAFAVRAVIAEQLNGGLRFDVQGGGEAPWLGWGPYLWADGLTPRSDGLTWACSDLAQDGTHPSAAGRQKVAAQLLSFVRSDPTASVWFGR